ncbi:hypothetical protein CHS0354_017991 [Potamilus streckersoni]|uniref:Peptidase C45 hydrolase domain-containing protein n=1 Tax=Potamilus streckersoni TaxID=2493646 RepID=A0AAE0RV78_9BIVA|nr:hypothetical protein CHS0354_017991 [Potamilus streckersoni]
MAKTESAQAIPLLFTRGTHYEVGHSIGSVFRERIQNYFNCSSFIQSCVVPFYNSKNGRDIFDEYKIAAEKCFPQYVREIHGMADGSGLQYEQIFLLNIAKEIFNIHYKPIEPESKKHVYGCSSVCLNTPDVKLLAHNEDCEPMIGPYPYLVTAHIVDPGATAGIVPCEEEQFTSFCYPGTMPGYAFGFNKHGIVMTINEILAKNVSVGSSPVSFITRAFMSASSVDDLIRISRNQGYGCADAFNVNIGSLSSKEMWSLEVGPGKPESPLKLTPIEEQNDPEKPCHYYHFNHFNHLEGVEQRHNVPCTFAHEKRMNDMISPRTVRDVKIILGDSKDTKYPIFRTPRYTDPAITVCTAYFDILQKTMEIYTENPNTDDPPLVKLPMTF